MKSFSAFFLTEYVQQNQGATDVIKIQAVQQKLKKNTYTLLKLYYVFFMSLNGIYSSLWQRE